MLVVAPEALWDTLGAGLGPLYPGVEMVPRPAPTSSGPDPYGLGSLAETWSPLLDAILLVAPTRRSPNRLVPAPVLHGVPIGIVQAESAVQLEPWLNALSANRNVSQGTWAVLAMWKERYLENGQRLARWMESGVKGRGIEVQTWFADMVSRQDVCQRLADGPGLALYVGHGWSRGWNGYRGLRWEHIAAAGLRKPCGVLLSLTCDTLKRTRGVSPFGCRWVSEGRACSYVGSVDRVKYAANMAFTHELGQLLDRGHCQTIGQLLQEVYKHLEQEPRLTKARRAFLTYRLMGNPLQGLC